MHTNLKHILLVLLVTSAFYQLSFSQIDSKQTTNVTISKSDSAKINSKDLLVTQQDSIKNDSLNKKKEFLDGKITSKAVGYKSNSAVKKTMTLYDKAEVYYQDIELKAGIIIIDYNTNLAYAKGIIDSTGTYTQKPSFKQGAQESEQDSLIYNFKNEKAVIYNTRTEQSGVYILGNITKRENDSTLYINKARFTTSKKKKPDYHIATNNIKVVPGKKVVGGLSQLYLAEVPTPAILPFFYAPLSKERSVSGIILPTWGESAQQGFFLQNGGYYFAISDYVDLAVLADVYTNGSWGIRFESGYNKRYKFSGNIDFSFENLISGQRGFSNFSKRNNYFITWSHQQDQKSNPNSRFSASVRLGSTRYFKQSLNELNLTQRISNEFRSSINYYKKFVNTPFNMNVALTHSQNNNTGKIIMSLPNLTVNMDRIYPFAPKNGTKKNALQNIGLSYNMSLQNQLNIKEDQFLKPGMFDEAKNGMSQRVNLGTNMKALKYISISPSASYEEIWYLKTIRKSFDGSLPENNQVVTDTINGFDSFRKYNGSISASTNIYGTFNFKKGRLKKIRHTVRPSISYNYTPDFSFYYDKVQQSNDPNDFKDYNRFQNGVFNGPSKGLNSSIGLALKNVFEAKIMPKDSTDAEPKKITLLNSLNFSTNYNFALDSLRWSPVSVSANTSFLNNKLTLNLGGSLDPYALNTNGNRINKFNINNGGSLFRLTRANINISYSISSDEIGKKKGKQSNNNSTNKNPDSDNLTTGNLTTRKSAFGNNNKEDKPKITKLFSATLPWNISLRHILTYSNRNRESDFTENSLQFSGSIELSPKWNVGISSGYDFKRKGIVLTSLNFERDLDSWRMSFNWVPFGFNKTYYFFIGVKSSVLSDLKYDQRSRPDRRLF